jgi:hypothetical protein
MPVCMSKWLANLKVKNIEAGSREAEGQKAEI